jgi:phosphatidylethanolamine/phosphatidyl-N-methylethanolamine N-methyltransferase
MSNLNSATDVARRRYDRIAPFFDLMEAPVEKSKFNGWRKLMWSKVEGSKILEIGVGTGKNFPYYPAAREIIAIDFSEKMLQRARARAGRDMVRVILRQMDVQNLEFDDNSFDTVAASFVFCSVPDAIHGLKEVKRVIRQGGKVVLLEHVLSDNPVVAWFMNLVNPLVVPIIENINSRTVENVVSSGLVVEKTTDLAAGIFKLIEARKATE